MGYTIGDGFFIYEFKAFDKDGNGFISADDLRQVLTKVGVELSEEEVDGMIREADIAGDGNINYRIFTELLITK